MIKEFLLKLFPVWDETKIRVGSLVAGKDPKGHEFFQGYVTSVTMTTVLSQGAIFNPDGSFKKWAEGWSVLSNNQEELEVLKY